jgi:excisionase family DNA binding protein
MAADRPETTGRKARGLSQQPAPSERLVYTVPEAGRLLGLSRNGSYEAAKRGDIPTIRIGRLLLVPKVPFRRMIELMDTGTAKSASKASRSWSVEPTAMGKRGAK